MEEQNTIPVAPAEPAPTKSDEPIILGGEKKNSKGMVAGLIILAVLAVAGIAFGVFEMMQASNKDKEIANLNQQVTNCANAGSGTAEKIEVTCPDGTITEVVSNGIDNASAQTIADPYLVYFGAFDNIFDHDFDVNAKLKIALDNLGANRVVSATMVGEWAVTVRYDDLNTEYKYLFGSEQEIERRSYGETGYGNYTYLDEGSGQFKVNLGGIGGTGGTLFSVVKGARYNGDNLIIDVYHDRAHWCESEDQIGNDYCVKAYSVPKSEAINDFIKDFADKIPVYTMTFAKDDGHYVLKDIKKQ